MRLGGVEAGGTKWRCAIGTENGEIGRFTDLPTTDPEETIGRAIEFFLSADRIDALGIAAFGPVELGRSSAYRGCIGNSPKPGWSGVDLMSPFRSALEVPIGIDTDVNAAGLAEHRSGSAVGLDVFCYVTVGTGIGGGVVVDGRAVHGLLHPELGHMRVPHDHERDPFPGSCPFHGDCLEGLASGYALRRRWGQPAQELSREDVWELEAEYLALGMLNVALTLAPQRILIGGGVLEAPGLLPLVQGRLAGLAAGYPGVAELEAHVGDYLVRPGLGGRSGVVGAFELAREAASQSVG
jgi:fructokinase